MKTLKYKIIKSKTQYKEYCNVLEELVFTNSKNKEIKDEIEMLTLLVEKYDNENNELNELDPVDLLQHLMDEHNLKAKDLVSILGINKSMVSEILNYKKGLSKDIIRTLAAYFKVSQEAFNRPYQLKSVSFKAVRNIAIIHKTKRLLKAH